MLGAIMHTADIQNRDGAPNVIADTKQSFPTLAHLFADGGYAGDRPETAMLSIEGLTIKLVKRPNGATGFVVIQTRSFNLNPATKCRASGFVQSPASHTQGPLVLANKTARTIWAMLTKNEDYRVSAQVEAA